MILKSDEKNIRNTFMYCAKLMLETLLCVCLSVLVHFYSNFLIFPIFFMVPIFLSIEYNRIIPYPILIFSGAIYDFLLNHFTGVYIFYFFFLYHGVKHFERFIFKSSPFKEWAFFCGLCVSAFLIQSVINIFIILNNDWIKIIAHSAASFIFLSLSYPICKIFILKIDEK